MINLNDALLGANEVAQHLRTIGVDAALLAEHDPRRINQGSWRSSDAQVRLERSPIDALILRFGGSLGPRQLANQNAFSLRLGPVPLAANLVLPVQYHWVVRVDPGPGPAFKATLRVKTRGIFRREFAGISWSGGDLAADLASDAELERLLLPGIGLDGKLSVEPDGGLGLVRVVCRAPTIVNYALWSAPIVKVKRGLPSREFVMAIERIAQKIRARAA